MARALFLLLFMLSTSTVSAQQVLDLWSTEHPAPHASPLTGNETIPDDMGRISHIIHPTLTVFLPEASKNTGKSVIICPGGGYFLLTTYNEGTFFAQHLAKNGIAAFVLKNRMPAGVHQIPLEDADRAMELVVQNAKKWGVDTAQIGVMGFSAGGHLAATLSTMGARRPAFSVLFYPVISMREGITHEGSREQLFGDLPLREYYSAELRVDRQTPPALLLHCQDDSAVGVANSWLYAQGLGRFKTPATVVIYPKGGHGWGFAAPHLPEREQMKQTVVEWIHKQ